MTTVVVAGAIGYGIVGSGDARELYNVATEATATNAADVVAVEKGAQSLVASTTQSRHVHTPDAVKAIYMTSWVASGSERREEMVRLIEETELNAIVIDVKDDTGKVSYDSKDPTVVAAGSVEVRIKDLPEFLASLREKGIYTIARIAVFQDPFLSKKWVDQAVQNQDGSVWKDRKGLSWIDASSRRYHAYIIALARDAYAIGFDEINLEYETELLLHVVGEFGSVDDLTCTFAQ